MRRVQRLLGLVAALLLIAGADSLAPAEAHADDASYWIKNRAYANQCMAAPDLTLNVVLRILPCDSGRAYRRWHLDRKPPARDRIYELRNSATDYCAEVNQNTSVPGELVDAWFCDGTTAVRWRAIEITVNWVSYYQFQHVGTNLCLDTVGSQGSQLMQWTCDPERWATNSAQLWKVEP